MTSCFFSPRCRLAAQLPPAASARLAMAGTVTPRSPQCRMPVGSLQQTFPVQAPLTNPTGLGSSCSLPAGRSCAWGVSGSQAGLRTQFLEGIAPEGKSERGGDAGVLGSEGSMARGHPYVTGTGTWQRRAACAVLCLKGRLILFLSNCYKFPLVTHLLCNRLAR